ncbi:hypothetical protein T4D_14385 [Trichinella pseudospiralis]|uniref:Uncharacterized protein n=1 Tax=Trichinella pseudospiralis TaxID=6337 RepID=A0A0V1FPR7_TRIPS|nr:hypothetical protein T4D_14385 [Trichinella pseudospiralis]
MTSSKQRTKNSVKCNALIKHEKNTQDTKPHHGRPTTHLAPTNQLFYQLITVSYLSYCHLSGNLTHSDTLDLLRLPFLALLDPGLAGNIKQGLKFFQKGHNGMFHDVSPRCVVKLTFQSLRS